MNIHLSPFAPGNLVSRDGFGSPVPRQPAHLYTQAESGAYLRDSSRVPRRRPPSNQFTFNFFPSHTPRSLSLLCTLEIQSHEHDAHVDIRINKDIDATLLRPSAATRPRVAVPGETNLPTQVTTDTK